MRDTIAEAFAAFEEAPCSNRERRLIRREQQAATHMDKGHGRIERRTLVATTMLRDHLDWPHARQVFRLERRRTIGGRTSVEVAYGITSLSPEAGSAGRLLDLTRRHWGIENRLFHIRDATFGEDASRVRTAHAPQNLAALRNASITLLAQTPHPSKAAALRRHAARYNEALDLIYEKAREN